jgi:hypothetical protein
MLAGRIGGNYCKMKRSTLIVVCLGIIGVVIFVAFAFVLLDMDLIEGLKPTIQEKPAIFTVSELSVYPNETVTGEAVQIAVIVKNKGDLEGTYTVELKINDEQKATQEIVLDGGGSQSILFTFTPENPGTYNVKIGGLISTFDVVLQIESHNLYREYKENEIAADAKYKNQVLYVEGVITDIGREILGRPYIILAGDTIFGVQCVFSTEHEPTIAQLTEGQSVTVKGTILGYLINVILEDCSIVS